MTAFNGIPTPQEAARARLRIMDLERQAKLQEESKESPEAADRRENARAHLIDACQVMDPNYRPNWHHKVEAEVFERFVARKAKRVILVAPPGSGKSDIVSRKGPAWAIGNDPSLFFALGSYSADLAESICLDSFNLTQTPEYRWLFPDAGIGRVLGDDSKVKSQAKEWRTRKKGGYKAAGRKGGFTGRHPSHFIVDDPFKDQEEADSPAIRNKVWDWFNGTVRKRMGAHGPILVMLTRWHPDDIVGRITKAMKEDPEAEQWEIVVLPARMDDIETRHPDDPRGLGEPLWPWYYAGGKPGDPKYLPGEIPEGHPDGMTEAEQDLAARKFLRMEEKTDIAGFMALLQGVPAPKSAYGAHAYSAYGPWNWVERWIPRPTTPVIVGMDFNYSPMCSVLLQETSLGQLFPGRYDAELAGRKCYVAFKAFGFKNCGTQSACEQIIDYMKEIGPGFTFKIYPDPAANSRTPHGEGGPSDLKIIQATFQLNGKFWVRIKNAHPKRKDRLNAANAAMTNKQRQKDGTIKEVPPLVYFVKSECAPLTRDFLECGYDEYLNGQFSDDDLGHASDGFGYFVEYEHPVAGGYTLYTKR